MPSRKSPTVLAIVLLAFACGLATAARQPEIEYLPAPNATKNAPLQSTGPVVPMLAGVTSGIKSRKLRGFVQIEGTGGEHPTVTFRTVYQQRITKYDWLGNPTYEPFPGDWCVDIPGAQMNQLSLQLQQWECLQGDQAQIFSLWQYMRPEVDGAWYHIVTGAELAWDVQGGWTGNGTPLTQWNPTSNDNQLFGFWDEGPGPWGVGWYSIRPRHAPNMCVAVPNEQLQTNGIPLIIWECNGGNDQLFKIWKA